MRVENQRCVVGVCVHFEHASNNGRNLSFPAGLRELLFGGLQFRGGWIELSPRFVAGQRAFRKHRHLHTFLCQQLQIDRDSLRVSFDIERGAELHRCDLQLLVICGGAEDDYRDCQNYALPHRTSRHGPTGGLRIDRNLYTRVTVSEIRTGVKNKEQRAILAGHLHRCRFNPIPASMSGESRVQLSQFFIPHRQCFTPSTYRTNDLSLGPNRVIHIMTALSAVLRKTIMTTFAINTDNNITAHGTPEEAAATSATSFDIFASQKELTDLATGWPAERLGSHL